VGDAGNPSVIGAPRQGRAPALPALAQPKTWAETSSTKCHVSPAVIKLQSNRTMVAFRDVVERQRNATWSSCHPGTPQLGA